MELEEFKEISGDVDIMKDLKPELEDDCEA